MIDISVIALIIVIAAITGGTSYITYRVGINDGYDEGYEEGYYAALADVKREMAKQGIRMEYDKIIDPRD